MDIQRILVGWPGGVQFSINQAALDFREKAKPLAQVKIGSKKITLQEIPVTRGRTISNGTNSKALWPESDLSAEGQESILRAQRDVLERIPEIDSLGLIFEETPVLLRKVLQIDSADRCRGLPQTCGTTRG